MLLTKEQILSVKDLKMEEVKVPEWGGSVLIRSMTGKERDEFEASLLIGKGKDRDVNMTNARARLVSLTVVDEKGERLFTAPSDVGLLGEKNAAALDLLFAVAQRLSGLRDKDVEELVGNSKTVPSEDSISD